MAKKNEILLSIALEGDQEVKAKLQAVGDASQKSLHDTQRTIGEAGNTAAQKLAEPIGKVREALAPIIEQGGIAGALGGAGLGGLGSLIGRFASSALSPAGLIAGITGSLIGLAKFGEETDRTKARLKGLGGNADAFGKLSGSAKELGTDVENLQPGFEKFLTYRRDLLAQNKYFPIFEGNTAVTPATDDAFLKAQGGLLAASRVDKTNTKEASAAIGQFFGSLFDNKLVTESAVRALQQVSPNAANFVARSISRPYGAPFKNADELVQHGGILQPNSVISDLARNAPKAIADAEAARGVTEAFEGLEAATKRLTVTMGGDHAGLTKGIDAASAYVDKAAEGVDQLMHAKDYQPGGGRFIGPVRPEDVPRAPQSLGEVFSSDKGDLLGRFVGYLRNDAASGINGGNPFGVITDFVKRAITDPGSIGQPIEVKPPPFQDRSRDINVEGPNGRRETYTPAPNGGDYIRREDPNPRYNWPIAPGPTAPVPSVSPEALPRVGEAQPQQQTADISSLISRILESVSAAANNASKPNLNVNEPATGGIRGEGPSGTATADASQSIAASGAKLAAALDGVTALISSVQAKGAPASVQAATGGSVVRKNMDVGGHVNGPGTSTSDSIPAMLSDGEYVIKTSSARKLGRARLDRLNAGNFAEGGDVTTRRLAMVKRFADGGEVSPTLASSGTSLGDGQHQIVYDPATGGAYIDGQLHLPGDPLLNDPIVQQSIAQSKAGMNQKPSKSKYKSWFVGRFGHSDDSDTYVAGGGPIGSSWAHFADGGQATISPMLNLGDGASGLNGGAPSLDDVGLAAPSNELLHPVTLDFGNRQVGGLRAAPSVLESLRKEARDRLNTQIGSAPDWYR
ncbi:hypothetical protein [Bradyrhizobium sp. BRP56]|uniref:hypothetical protein n=1 Tax=Bradyrhizobium sp. BRP56 TaxID=2793819 RepID=UPI001CD719C4|nr:hypothetical protein [Bradyrhizobium sp. BRP56]MCA1399355.1 hypothetical protein [Bradyrhizobium sp. BRP56]